MALGLFRSTGPSDTVRAAVRLLRRCSFLTRLLPRLRMRLRQGSGRRTIAKLLLPVSLSQETELERTQFERLFVQEITRQRADRSYI